MSSEIFNKTVTEIFLENLREQPDAVLYNYVDGNVEITHSLTYAKIDERSKVIAKYLVDHGLKGQKIGLFYLFSPEFAYSFWGCLFAGCVPVPLNIPLRSSTYERAQRILDDCDAHIILTDDSIHKLIGSSFEGKAINLISTEQIKDKVETFEYHLPGRQDLVLLQYTSGSTGQPKGVMVPHDAMIRNCYDLSASGGHQMARVGNWLPAYHDMGFVTGFMMPVIMGLESFMMSPMTFLKKPSTWLKLWHKYKINVTYTPNFGIGICTAKITDEEMQGLDLSSMEMIYNGSEPIRISTIINFNNRFKNYGLSPNAMRPCYGMAEIVLFVSTDFVGSETFVIDADLNKLKSGILEPAQREGIPTVPVVNCGRVWGDTRVAIVDPEECRSLPPNHIGEIWMKGSFMTQGYWNKPETNEEIFNAEVKETGEKGWLRTGDLGAYIDRGLYITGRLKEMIIIRGQNYYPHDLEACIDGLDQSFRINNTAAFSYNTGSGEKLAIVQEIIRRFEKTLDPEKIFMEINAKISEEFEITLDAICLIPQGSLAKTSSGKIQRLSMRKRMIDGSLEVLHKWERKTSNGSINEQVSDDTLKGYLLNLVSEKVQIPTGQIEQSVKLKNYGLDSLMAVEITEALESRIKHPLEPNMIWEFETIDRICEYIEREVLSEKH